ncbi:class I SAM-dependent methyltransferase [Flavobacterium sp.]|uniref:class I SAM-dependent methyltransferase n=1 Tax=Flavobacterium sp. TaxID=239 RepID=UPI00261C9F2B|nr:class I SAM-dependent methyltransferase [Flavobacterium sp.]
MDRYRETFNTWNKVAELYQEKFMNLDLYNESYDLFCEAITIQNAKLLELGCGPGNITKYLLEKRPDFKIQAVDIAPNMIQLAQQNIPNATFKVMDVREINSIEKQFDAIMCGFCIPYLSESDVSKLVADCHQLLKENGLLYLSFVAGDYTDSGYQKGSSGDRTYFYYHNLEKTVHVLEIQGFTIEKLMTVNYKYNNGKEEKHTVLIPKKSST